MRKIPSTSSSSSNPAGKVRQTNNRPNSKSSSQRNPRSPFTITATSQVGLKNGRGDTNNNNSLITLDGDEGLLDVSYLEKDAKLHKINEELEKRSQELFQKIERYSNRCRNAIETAAGGDTLPVQPKDDLKPDKKSEMTLIDHRDDHDLRNSSSSDVHENDFPLTDLDRASPDTKEVDLKARKRLQKATESVVKCLQSKLLSHESRLADLHLQFRQKMQENTMLESKLRAMEDDRERLLKSLSNLQTSADKCAKNVDLAKSNLSQKLQTMNTLKRDIDSLKRDQKQKATMIQSLQTRLDRALEENERLKMQNRNLTQNLRDKQSDDRTLIDDLQGKIVQLEQQKSILNATIGKQAGLIKTLRQQRNS